MMASTGIKHEQVFARRRRRRSWAATTASLVCCCSATVAWVLPSAMGLQSPASSSSLPSWNTLSFISDEKKNLIRRDAYFMEVDEVTSAEEQEQPSRQTAAVLPPVDLAFWKAYVPDSTNAPINLVGVDDDLEDVLYTSFHLSNRNGHSKSLDSLLSSHTDRNGAIQAASAAGLPPDVHVSASQDTTSTSSSRPVTVRKLWKRRHARSIQEGIRRENSTHQEKLYSLLSRTTSRLTPSHQHYAARTISGLIHALAEEAHGVEVKVDSRQGTPFWNKHVENICINFSRLGFRPLRMGGLNKLEAAIETFETSMDESHKAPVAKKLELSAVSNADEAFERIDVDKSGALDPEEIAQALNLAANDVSDEVLLEGLASELVDLYDANGDGVVDREEYQTLVADMASLRQAEKEKQEKREVGRRGVLGRVVRFVTRRNGDEDQEESIDESEQVKDDLDRASQQRQVQNVTEITSDSLVQSVAKGAGSITFSDLRLDLRQLLFGFLPLLKRITPGGPLILEPFTMTVTGSFNSQDIKDSTLLDAGLRRLVARAIRLRVRSLRDLTDGALFSGRKWNLASKSAPKVEVLELRSVEFDDQDRLIMTGTAQIQTNPSAPIIENSFKVRTRIGTHTDGRVIRLVEPELALVLECSKALERSIVAGCKRFGLPVPTRPEPLYSFFPIYSPFGLNDKGGFNLGADNCIKSIFVKDGALQFEMSAILRPGRFLGNHYLAFTIPNRTFIITMDRVREGIRAARANKRAALAAKRAAMATKNIRRRNKEAQVQPEVVTVQDDLKFKEDSVDEKNEKINPPATVKPKQGTKSFFSRFVEGYTGIGKDEDERNERLTLAISDWFGRQDSNGGSKSSDDASKK